MMGYIESPYDKILQEDLEYLTAQYNFSALYHSSVFVTGATGLIGSHIVKLLALLNRTRNADIRVYALIRDAVKARRSFDGVYEKINIITGDITNIPRIDHPVDYIIHGASITASRTFIEKPVETIDTAYTGTRAMLDFAKEKQAKGLVYLSSMEVFGITDTRHEEITESDYGYIDILNPRSSYSESKRLCECLCACYAQEYGIPAKIARLVQVLGPGVDYNDTRVGAQFARSVIENRDIILKTEGKTRRPCIYTRDAIAGIITVLIKGNAGEAYNVANAATVATIRETADMIAKKIAGGSIRVVLDIDVPDEYAPNLNLNLNLNRAKSLGWKAEIGLEEAYRRMIESMKERKRNG